jgi:deazaflavin-dependent oxidoreductase (nitroreductase family)
MTDKYFKERFARYQIKLRVIGRKSGKTISIPVWFVLEREKLFLLPVQGPETQWYKNVLKNPSIRIDAQGVDAEFRASPVTGANIRCGGCGWNCAINGLLEPNRATDREAHPVRIS